MIDIPNLCKIICKFI